MGGGLRPSLTILGNPIWRFHGFASLILPTMKHDSKDKSGTILMLNHSESKDEPGGA